MLIIIADPLMGEVTAWVQKSCDGRGTVSAASGGKKRG